MRTLFLVALISLCLTQKVSIIESASSNFIHNGATTHLSSWSSECDDFILTVLAPYLSQEIGRYYSSRGHSAPEYSPMGSKITQMKVADSYNFTVTITTEPYVGAHISVGRDQITLFVNQNGVKTISYVHLADSELPPYLQQH